MVFSTNASYGFIQALFASGHAVVHVQAWFDVVAGPPVVDGAGVGHGLAARADHAGLFGRAGAQ